MQNIAIVGLGVMGKNHYRTLKNIEGVRIVGLCDITKHDHYEEPFFTELLEMLDLCTPHAVIIAAPTFLHKEIALECAKRKINIFLEKIRRII